MGSLEKIRVIKMIYCYTGRPGSGKSLDVCKDIKNYVRRGKYVITNFPVKGYYTKYLRNFEMTPNNILNFVDGLRRPCFNHAEDEYLLVIDEAQMIFNARDWLKNSRQGWTEFFTQHRKLGFRVIIVTQNMDFIDKQIRACVEYEVEHRRCSRFGLFGALLGFVFGDFLARVRWAGSKEILYHYNYRFSKCLAEMYDTYMMFS